MARSAMVRRDHGVNALARCAVLVSLAFQLWASAVSAELAPRLVSIAPTSGSLAGGTLITITGEDLASDMYSSSTKAYVGEHECELSEYYSGFGKVVCSAPSSLAAVKANVTVFQNGLEVKASAPLEFSYNWDDTPRLLSVSPSSVEPGENVTISMHNSWFNRGDKHEKYDEENAVVTANGIVLEHQETEPENTYSRNEDTKWVYRADGPISHRVELVVKAPEVAGLYNISVEFQGPDRGTKSFFTSDLYSQADGSVPFMLSVHPKVAAVSRDVGSPHGGQAVTITGKGFGSDAAEVAVRTTGGDLLCDVGAAGASLSDDKIVCITASAQSQGSKPELFEAALNETYLCDGKCVGFGGRGTLIEQWPVDSAVKNLDQLESHIAETAPENSTILAGHGMSTPEENSGGVRLTSIFVPEVAGTYTFQARAFNYAKRTKCPTRVTVTFQNGTSAISSQNFYNHWVPWWDLMQRSSSAFSLDLADNEPVMVQALALPQHNQNIRLQVAAFAPKPVETAASAMDIQTLRVLSSSWGPIVSFKFQGVDLGGETYVYETGKVFSGQTIPLDAAKEVVAKKMKLVFDTTENINVAVGSVTEELPADQNQTSTNQTATESPPAVPKTRVTLYWNLTFPARSAFFGSEDPRTWTIQTAAITGDDVTVGYEVTRNHSMALNGTFDIGLSGNDSITGLPFDASSNEIEAAFAAKNVAARVASRWGNDQTGFYWRTEFPKIQSWWTPQQLTLNLSNVAGQGVSGMAYHDLDSSVLGVLEGPLPAQLLRAPRFGFASKETSVMEVQVGGVVASCSASNGCSFTTDASAVATVTGVSPAKAAAGEVITIAGSGFSDAAEGNSVKIGSDDCAIQLASTTELRCKLGPTGTSGTKKISVSIGDGGASAPLFVETDYTILDSFVPSSISNKGQTLVQITGSGFEADCSRTLVKAGDTSLVCTKCTETELTCVVSPAELDGTIHDLHVSVDSVVSTFSDKLFVNENEHGLASFAPATIPASGGQIVLTGHFQSLSLQKVTLTSDSLGDVECDVGSTTDTTVVATVPEKILPGSYRVRIVVSGSRTIQSSSDLQVSMTVTGVTPASGSLAGGSVLTIAGSGFSANSEVLLSVPVSTTHASGLIACDVLTTTTSEITCRTRGYCSANASPADPSASKCSYKEPPGPSSITVIQCPDTLKDAFGQRYSTDTDAGRILCWDDETTHKAACSGASCGFKYEEASTALVSAAEPSSAKSGTQITVHGSWPAGQAIAVQLESPAKEKTACESVAAVENDVEARRLQQNTFPLDWSGFTSSAFTSSDRITKVTCTIPTLQAGMYRVLGDGDTGKSISQALFTATNDISLVGKLPEYSLGGGALLSLESSSTKFNADNATRNNVTVAGLPCEITEVLDTTLKCVLPDASSAVESVSDFKLFQQSLDAQVKVVVNGVTASCAQQGGCKVTYGAGTTPFVSHSSLAFQTSVYNYTIIGTFGLGETDTLSLEIAGETYEGTYYKLGQDFATFAIGQATPAGQYDVVVKNQAGQRAAWSLTDLKRVTVEPSVTSISPARGSVFGGTVVTLSGFGFPKCADAAACNDTSVHMQVSDTDYRQVQCKVAQSTANSLQCELQAAYFDIQGEDLSVAKLFVKIGNDENALEATKAIAFTLFSYTVDSVQPATVQPTDTSTTISAFCTNCGHLATATDAKVVLKSEMGDVSTSTFAYDGGAGGLPKFTFSLAGFANIVAGDFNVSVESASSGNARMSPSALVIPVAATAVNATQGTRGGGQILKITGTGFTNFDAFGKANKVLVGTRSCDQISAAATEIVCKVAAPASAEEDQVTGGQDIRIKTSHMAEYSLTGLLHSFADSLTPTVTSVTPLAGSTEGGTAVTIIGEGFSAMEGTPVVSFGSAGRCDQDVSMSSNGTHQTLTCKTSAVSEPFETAQPLYVEWPGAGYASGNFTFFQADFWSSPTTWGGDPPPVAGDSVVVPKNTTVLLDQTTPNLNLIVIEGELVWAPPAGGQKIELNAKYIFLHKGGKLRIGSEDEPYNGQAVITMHGDRKSKELPMYGAKVIAVRQGSLELHGQKKMPAWTKLSATARVGDNSITVSGPVNWKAGDQIVVASSSLRPQDAEEAFIVSVSDLGSGNVRIDLDRSLQFTHLGVVATVAGRQIDMRAEVGCLSRNVVIRGDDDHTLAQKYGPHIHMHDHRTGNCLESRVDDCGVSETFMRLSDVEMRNCGQSSRLGRYCIHFHMHGDASRSYLRGNAVHHSFHRAVAIHGTHRLRLIDNVAYNIEGHAYFLEDGIEMENVFEGNLGIWARRSHSSLNTDASPAVFWITNPQNYFRGNVAAGSDGYGFWFRMRSKPDGASFSTKETVCPKWMPLAEFDGNTAHSSDKYGLRIFEEWFPGPIEHACKKQWWRGSNTAHTARLTNFLAYKNGMKGAIATVFGNIQFDNFVVADNGAGPNAHVTNGKDHGGGVEFTNNRDSRRPTDMPISDMPGLHNSLVVARTVEGQVGTAGYWPKPDRGIRGLITQSPKGITDRCMLGVTNVTFHGFTGGSYFALEACGKCKDDQGAASTYFQQITMRGAGLDEKYAIAKWTWPHQGVFVDTDGSLLGETCDSSGCSSVSDATFVADNGLLRDSECKVVTSVQNIGGRVCNPGIRHRRVMIDNVRPRTERYYDLRVWQVDDTGACPKNEYNISICKMEIPYSKFNNEGHSFHVITGRTYDLEIGSAYRTDYQKFRVLGLENMETKDYIILKTRYTQVMNHFKVNSDNKENSVPSASALVSSSEHASFFYDRGAPEYNPAHNATETVMSLFVSGRSRSHMTVHPNECPEGGCSVYDGTEGRNGTFQWSQDQTWLNCTSCFPNEQQREEKVQSGYWNPRQADEVFIPAGMKVVVDLSTPTLRSLHIQGELEFSRTVSPNAFTLNADYILVDAGNFTIGTAEEPYTRQAAVKLHGTRADPFQPIQAWTLGGKILSAINGGRISIHGLDAGRRWSKMEPASAGASEITLDEAVSWSAGQKIVITGNSWNQWERDVHEIESVSNGGRTLSLKGTLRFDHNGIRRSAGSSLLDTRAEVGLMSSNVVVAAGDADAQYHGLTMDHPQYTSQDLALESPEGPHVCHQSQNSAFCKFGCQIVSVGSELQLQNVAVEHCGQAGVEKPSVSITNPKGSSYVLRSSLVYNMEGAIQVKGSQGSAAVKLNGNFVHESLDKSAVVVETSGNEIRENLVHGVMKIDKSNHDFEYPTGIEASAGGNKIDSNIVAGSDRFGYNVKLDGCSSELLFKDNAARSCLIGFYVTESGTGCSIVTRQAASHSWDFGLFAKVKGFTEDLVVEANVFSDTKKAGLRVVRKGRGTVTPTVTVNENTFIASSSVQECQKCQSARDRGCHARQSQKSYTMGSGIPNFGMISTTFATVFSIGPEKKPWDLEKGYSTVNGISYLNDNVFEGYAGADSCGLDQYAFANDKKAADAFHPHVFANTTWLNAGGRQAGDQKGKVYFVPPSDSWRNPSDCGMAVFDCEHPHVSQSDHCLAGKSIRTIPLNCQGPNHVLLTDADGTFAESGSPGFVMANHLQDQPGPFEQMIVTNNPTCKAMDGASALECLNEASSDSQPPQLLVIESRDADTEDRNYSPLILEQESTKRSDLLITAMDRGWCFGYTCQKRLSTFWTYAETNDAYNLHFTGTPAKMTRLWMPYAKPESEIVMRINYFSAGRRFVWVKGQGRKDPLRTLEDCVGRDGNFKSEQVKNTCVPRVGDGNPHGSYFWHQASGVLYVKLTGEGKSLEVRTEQVVAVSAKLDMNFADFYEERYIENMANLLEIDPSRIKVVSVIPGSVVIDFIVLQDPKVLEASGIYDDIPESEVDETAFNDPADDPPEEEEDSSSNDDTTSSNDGTEAPAPAPPTEESSQPAEGISNDFLAQMELQQAEMAKAIEQQLDEIATSGQLQESLKETFGDDVSYMSLSTKVEEPAAGPSTSEDEQTESSSTKNIIVGGKVVSGKMPGASSDDDVPGWLIWAGVGVSVLFFAVVSLFVVDRRKRKRALMMSGGNAGVLKGQMAFKATRIGSAPTSRFGKLFSFRNKHLFETTPAKPLESHEISLESGNARGRQDDDMGLIEGAQETDDGLKVDNPLMVIAVEEPPADLYHRDENPIYPEPAGKSEQTCRTPALPDVVTISKPQDPAAPDVAPSAPQALPEVVTKKKANINSRDSNFKSLVMLGQAPAAYKSPVERALDEIKREEERKARQEQEAHWRREQSRNKMEDAVAGALADLEEEEMTTTSSKTPEQSGVVSTLNEAGEKEFVDVDNPIFAKTHSEVADDDVRSRTYRAHVHNSRLGKVEEMSSLPGSSMQDVSNPVFTRTDSEVSEDNRIAAKYAARASAVASRPISIPEDSSKVAKYALESSSFSRDKIDDSVAQAMAELEEEGNL